MPKKPATDVKAIIVPVRFTAEQRELIRLAAARDHLDVSTWLRRLALREAGGPAEKAKPKPTAKTSAEAEAQLTSQRRKLDLRGG